MGNCGASARQPRSVAISNTIARQEDGEWNKRKPVLIEEVGQGSS
jgi:hypothetical protein